MQQCSRFLILCCLSFLPVFVFAQMAENRDLTGLWKGTMYNDTTQLNYRYEIAISEKKGKLYGYSHTYFILGDREYHGVKRLKIKVKGDEVITEDVELIANNYPIKPPKGVRELNILQFEMRNNNMVLNGRFETNRTKEYAPATGLIYVERKSDYKNSALIPHLEELGLAKDLSFVQDQYAVVESKPVTVTEKPAVKTSITAPATEEEKPVVKTSALPVKTETKTDPPKEQAIVKTTPVVKDKPVVKTETPVKKEPVAEKPVAKTEPVVKKEPVVEKPVTKQPEPVVAKAEQPKNVFQPVTNSAADADKRKIETIEALYFKTDSLVLTLYDNGEVDGDTVSVLMNGNVLMPRVGLSTKAVSKTIYTNDISGDSIQLVMYAETLGTLPPNTGLLIVYDGNDRYEIRFSGDMQKSSAIVFRRRK